MTLQGCFGAAGTLPRPSPRMVQICKSLSPEGPPRSVNLTSICLQVYRTFRHRKQKYRAMKIRTIHPSSTDTISPKMHKMEMQTLAADNSTMPCEGCVFLFLPFGASAMIIHLLTFCPLAQVPAYSPYVVERYFPFLKFSQTCFLLAFVFSRGLSVPRSTIELKPIGVTGSKDALTSTFALVWQRTVSRSSRTRCFLLCPAHRYATSFSPKHFPRSESLTLFCFSQELKPFPSSRCLKYLGHTVWWRCVAVSFFAWLILKSLERLTFFF